LLLAPFVGIDVKEDQMLFKSPFLPPLTIIPSATVFAMKYWFRACIASLAWLLYQDATCGV
jgi:hypothetical protein